MAPTWIPVTTDLWGIRCVLSRTVLWVQVSSLCFWLSLWKGTPSYLWGHRHLLVGLISPRARLSLIFGLCSVFPMFLFPFAKYKICVSLFFSNKNTFLGNEKNWWESEFGIFPRASLFGMCPAAYLQPIYWESGVPDVAGLGRVEKVQRLCLCRLLWWGILCKP